jgi:hypothetical protein
MESSHSNQQVREGDDNTFSGLLPLDPSGKLGDFERHWMDHDGLAEFLNESAPPLAIGFTPGAVDSVRQFHHRDRRKRDLAFPAPGLHTFGHIPHTRPMALARDQNAGVKD